MSVSPRDSGPRWAQPWQAGIIAAGAVYAMEHQQERLAKDHKNAKLFAEGIAGLAGIGLDVATVETNIIIFRLTKGNALTSLVKAHEKGVFVLPNGPDTIRAV